MVVEHLRLFRQLLGDRERTVWVARQQYALGQLGRRLQVDGRGRGGHARESMEDSGSGDGDS
jgi:hypothetical protein